MQKKPQRVPYLGYPRCLVSYAWGTSTIMDIFGTSAPRVSFGTLAEDGRCLNRYFRAVGNGFTRVMSEESSRTATR